MAELILNSWETIARRTWMMALGTFSPAEYRRMVSEKAEAAYRSGLALAKSRGGKTSIIAAIAPWRSRAAANAKRLRRK
jgi:hypothetical protein